MEKKNNIFFFYLALKINVQTFEGIGGEKLFSGAHLDKLQIKQITQQVAPTKHCD